MAIAQRIRQRSTEHFRETVDSRYERHWTVSTGATYIDRTRDRSSEQFYYSPDQSCIDTVGYWTKDNPLYLRQERVSPPLISYTAGHQRQHTDPFGIPLNTAQLNRRTFEGWGSYAHALEPEDSVESDVEFVTRAAGALNPSRSDFQATVFLAELRDLPSLFKNVGEEFAQQGVLRASGGNYLKGQFGWRPLIKDLRTFFNVADKLQKRMKTLKELRGRGMIRRQFKEKDGRGTQIKHAISRIPNDYHQIGIYPTSYEGDRIYWEVHTEMRTTRWCDIEFVMDTPSNLFAPMDSELWDEAHSLVYGTTIDGPALWAAMPWSWLIDWGTNMTDYIKSQNNTVGAKYSKAVLMKTTERYSTIYPILGDVAAFNSGWTYSFTPGRVSTITKERILDVDPGAVSTAEAILGDGFRSSILSALTVQRFAPKHRINL